MIYDLLLSCNYGLYPAIDFETNKRIKNELERITDFEKRLVYYNKKRYLFHSLLLSVSEISPMHHTKPQSCAMLFFRFHLLSGDGNLFRVLQ